MWLVIVIVIVLGMLIVLLELTLESIVVWLERHQYLKVSSLEWFSNDTLQSQRMAHEELELGDWQGCTGPQAIPTTQRRQLLGVLDWHDPKHPRLVKISSVFGGVGNVMATDDSSSSSSSSTNEQKVEAVVTEKPVRASQDSGQGTVSSSPARARASEDSQSIVVSPISPTIS